MANRLKRLLTWRNQSGDTIVEVLVSIVILALVLTAAYALSTHSLGSSVDAQRRSKALAIAEGQVNRLVDAQNGLTTGLAKYVNNPGQSFCIQETGSPQSDDCTTSDNVYKTHIVYDKNNFTFTVTTTWARSGAKNNNQVQLYYKSPASYIAQIDRCTDTPGIQTSTAECTGTDQPCDPATQNCTGCKKNCGGGNGGNPTPTSTGEGGALPVCHVYGVGSDGSVQGNCENGRCSDNTTATTQATCDSSQVCVSIPCYTNGVQTGFAAVCRDNNDNGGASDVGFSPGASGCSSSAIDSALLSANGPCGTDGVGDVVNGTTVCNPYNDANVCPKGQYGTPPNCHSTDTATSNQDTATSSTGGGPGGAGCDVNSALCPVVNVKQCVFDGHQSFFRHFGILTIFDNLLAVDTQDATSTNLNDTGCGTSGGSGSCTKDCSGNPNPSPSPGPGPSPSPGTPPPAPPPPNPTGSGVPPPNGCGLNTEQPILPSYGSLHLFIPPYLGYLGC